MDYLIEEVLNVQYEKIRNFLLRTSILEQFCGPLCDELLEQRDSQLIIESPDKNNMFIIPLDYERKWFRYHHLFADLLKRRWLILNNAENISLHTKACNWFEKNKMFSLAIDHAFECGDQNKALELLDNIVESFWKNGQHHAIIKFGDLIPIRKSLTKLQ